MQLSINCPKCQLNLLKTLKKMAQADPNNPDQMLQAQFSVQQYSNFLGYESALIKAVKDMVHGIIAKI